MCHGKDPVCHGEETRERWRGPRTAERGARWSAERVGVRSALECGARWSAERVGVRSALECGARWSAERVGVRSALECGARWSAERVGVGARWSAERVGGRSAVEGGARWSAERVGVRSALECGERWSAERGLRSAGSVKTPVDEEVVNEETAQLRDTTRLLGDCGSYAVAPPYECLYSALAVMCRRGPWAARLYQW